MDAGRQRAVGRGGLGKAGGTRRAGGWIRPDTGTRGQGDKGTPGQGDKGRKSEGIGRAWRGGHRLRQGDAARGWLSQIFRVSADLQVTEQPELTFQIYVFQCDKCGAFQVWEQFSTIENCSRQFTIDRRSETLARRRVRRRASRLTPQRPAQIRNSSRGGRLRSDYFQDHETNETSSVSQRTVSNFRKLFTIGSVSERNGPAMDRKRLGCEAERRSVSDGRYVEKR